MRDPCATDAAAPELEQLTDRHQHLVLEATCQACSTGERESERVRAPALRPYQLQAVERIEAEIAAFKRVLLDLATGAGKTVVAGAQPWALRHQTARYAMKSRMTACQSDLLKKGA